MCACVHWGLQLAHQTHSSRESAQPFQSPFLALQSLCSNQRDRQLVRLGEVAFEVPSFAEASLFFCSYQGWEDRTIKMAGVAGWHRSLHSRGAGRGNMPTSALRTPACTGVRVCVHLWGWNTSTLELFTGESKEKSHARFNMFLRLCNKSVMWLFLVGQISVCVCHLRAFNSAAAVQHFTTLSGLVAPYLTLGFSINQSDLTN